MCLIAVRDGCVKIGDAVACASSRKSYTVKEVGVMVRLAAKSSFSSDFAVLPSEVVCARQ